MPTRGRRCAACGKNDTKNSFIRVVRRSDGFVEVDKRGGKMPGRGAYICCDRECLKVAVKKKSLARSLKSEVSPQVYVDLEAVIIEFDKSPDTD